VEVDEPRGGELRNPSYRVRFGKREERSHRAHIPVAEKRRKLKPEKALNRRSMPVGEGGEGKERQSSTGEEIATLAQQLRKGGKEDKPINPLAYSSIGGKIQKGEGGKEGRYCCGIGPGERRRKGRGIRLLEK